LAGSAARVQGGGGAWLAAMTGAAAGVLSGDDAVAHPVMKAAAMMISRRCILNSSVIA
jgi:hypothetical protein